MTLRSVEASASPLHYVLNAYAVGKTLCGALGDTTTSLALVTCPACRARATS